MKEEQRKQKLTLAINKEVIDKAKEAGLNISSITEEILKVITSDPNDPNTQDAVVVIYEQFFDVLKPYLKKYGAEVEVGSIPNKISGVAMKTPIVCNHKGLQYPEPPLSFPISLMVMTSSITPAYVSTTVNNVIEHLYNANTILENFLTSIAKASSHNKEKIDEFKFALRFVKALSEGEEDKK